ncbi:MAG: hypothetical protein ABJQ34_13345 [Paracoccaceae bacterium]
MALKFGDLNIYTQDSFFTLSPLAQAGLGAVSALLAILTVWIVYKSTRRFPLPIRLVIALAAIWVFIWVSPQIYYAYYLTIFDDLPLQLVIKAPPSPLQFLRFLTFTEHSSMSAHSVGVLGWASILAAAAKKTRPRRSAAN